MHSHSLTGWGTDEDALVEALGMTTTEERMTIPIKYQDIHDEELRSLMKKECGKGDLGLALQYLGVTPVEAECRMILRRLAMVLELTRGFFTLFFVEDPTKIWSN